MLNIFSKKYVMSVITTHVYKWQNICLLGCVVQSVTCLTLDPGVASSKIVSEYDQEIPQSQTADSPMALQGRAFQPSQDTGKPN